MNLSAKEQTALLQRYEPFIRRRVFRFFNKLNFLSYSSLDDLMQESRQAFWVQMLSAEDEADLRKRAPRRMFDAMWEYCRCMASVYIPHNQYQKRISSYAQCPVDVHDLEALLPRCTMDDAEFHIMLDIALSRMPDREQTVIRMQLAGHRDCEIMPVLSIHSVAVMSRLSRRAAEHLAEHLGYEFLTERRP